MDKLEKDLDNLLRQLAPPGAIISIHSKTYGDLELLYGYSKLETRQPMTVDQEFRIGSVTKTFTGTLLLQLVDEDKIKLDEPVENYLLGIPNGDNITVREIGSMRSGIFNYTEDEQFQATLEENPERIWLSSELLLLGIRHPPYFEPGADFHYSNTNTAILASIVERVDNRTYSRALQKRLLIPLGLTSTRYSAFLGRSGINGYVYHRGRYRNVTYHNDSWAWSAGEIISTVSDMHRYLRKSIAGHQTLSSKVAKEQRYWQTTERIGNKLIRRYGFQLMKMNSFIGHNGSLPGYNTFILYSLGTQTSVVIVCNTQTTKNGKAPADELAALIVNQLQ